MKDTPDLELLARRYLDLCQDQMAALANDPALAEGMARAYAAMMARGAAFFAQTAPGPAGGPKTGVDEPEPASSPTSGPRADRPAAAAAAPGGADDDAARLAGRVAELEERIGRLEAAFAAIGGGAEERPRRHRR